MLNALIKEECKGMQDDLIFVMSLTILAFFLVDVFNAHLFALDALISIGNTILTMYYYYKHRK
jgi:hypothetical protein